MKFQQLLPMKLKFNNYVPTTLIKALCLSSKDLFQVVLETEMTMKLPNYLFLAKYIFEIKLM